MDRQTTIFTNPRAYERVIIFTSIAILALILPTIIHSQLITGSFVNMSLILVTFLIGPLEAVFLGLMPSVIALSSGLLPLPLAPAIPFIMISNTILVGIYYYLGRKNLIASIFIASFIKFLFLYGVTGSLVPLDNIFWYTQSIIN